MENLKAINYKIGIDPSHVVICFGGMYSKYIEDPINVELPFEFSRECSDINCSYILVRDLEQVWYNKGIDPKYNTIPLSVQYIQMLLEEMKPTSVSTIGCSAGGYGAILFGYLLKVDKVHSFCPQIFLDSKLRNGFRDYRFKVPQDKLLKNVVRSDFFDLKNILQNSNGKTEINIYCCKYNSDLFHIDHIKDCPNIVSHIYECNDHAVNLFVTNKLKLPLKSFMYLKR